MFIIGATGLLLAWKKEFYFLPPTKKDVVTGPSLPLEKIQDIASQYIFNNTKLDTLIDRIDVRLNSGVAKVRFVNHYSEVQVGIRSGKILSVDYRASDLIEQIHDGSIIDSLAGTEDDWFKKFYVTLTCIGLMTLSITGFYLWYNPKLIKRRKKK